MDPSSFNLVDRIPTSQSSEKSIMIAITIKVQARINDANYEISRFVNYSNNRKLISLYLVITLTKWGSGVEYCSLHYDLVNIQNLIGDDYYKKKTISNNSDGCDVIHVVKLPEVNDWCLLCN